MIGIVHRNVAAATVEVLSLGPIWPGVVIRGIWFSIQPANASNLDICIAVCGAPASVISDLRSAQSLVDTTDTPVAALGMPSVRFTMGTIVGREFTVPVNVPIREGPVWIGAGVLSSFLAYVSMGVSVDVERNVAPSIERGSAARRIRTNGRVIQELREVALAERG